MKKKLILAGALIGGLVILETVVEISAKIGFVVGAMTADRIMDDEFKKRKKSNDSWKSYFNPNHVRKCYGFEDPVFNDYISASKALRDLEMILEDYAEVSVGDMRAVAGLDSNYNDTKYGWTDLSGSYIVNDHGKYVLCLPKVKLL